MTDGNSPDQGDSIDDLIAKMYGSSHEDQTPLDPEQAKEEAIRLSKLEEEVLGLIEEDLSNLGIPGLEFSADEIVTQATPIDARLDGVGLGKIKLHHYWDRETDQARILGVHTPTSLNVYLHTDKATLDQAKKVAKTKNISRLWTRYLFDKDGNYGKLSFFPATIVDSRQDADRGPWDGVKMIVGEMNAGDFELAGTALQKLKEVITRPQNNRLT